MYTHPQFLVVTITEDSQTPWTLVSVYGSPDHALQKFLWQDLNAESLNIEGPLMICGDFNSVVSVDEVSSLASWNSHKSSGFQEWIFEQGLLDMGFCRSKFTWTRGIHELTFKGARLDRALCNVEWNVLFPEAAVTHLPRIGSDHSPILVTCKVNRHPQGPKPFRFQAAWLTHPSFK